MERKNDCMGSIGSECCEMEREGKRKRDDGGPVFIKHYECHAATKPHAESTLRDFS